MANESGRKDQKNGFLSGYGPLITAITAIVLCVFTFSTVQSATLNNRELITKLETGSAKQVQRDDEIISMLHKLDKAQTADHALTKIMAAKMGITAPQGD